MSYDFSNQFILDFIIFDPGPESDKNYTNIPDDMWNHLGGIVLKTIIQDHKRTFVINNITLPYKPKDKASYY